MPTPTPTATPTATPEPTATPRPTSTPAPTATPLPPTKYDRSLLLFGPYDTQIAHEPENRRLEAYRALDAPGDILIEAIFVNPYPDPDLKWEHGFLFKRGASNHFYSTTLESTEDWEHYARMGERGIIGFWDGPRPEINTASGEENLFQVALVGDIAWAYINGVLAGKFPADLDTGGNGVRFIVDDDYEGTTTIKDAAVWRWDPSMHPDFPEVDPSFVPPPTPTPTITPTPNPVFPFFGPASDVIFHDEADGKIERYRGPDIDGDVMIEVTVVVPFEPNESNWNFGIQFRNDRPGSFHLVEVGSIFGGSYNHWRRSGSGEEWRGHRVEDVVGMNLQKGDKNRIQLIVVGDSGHLYINNRRAGILNFDLGDIPTPNRIYLVVIDRDSQGFEYSKGGHTKFEDFTVWKWHPSLFELPKDD